MLDIRGLQNVSDVSAKDSIWWPKFRKDIDSEVSNCIVCSKHRSQNAEPLMPASFPDRPWKKVGTDLFEWKRSNYLLVIDYYSRYIQVAKLTSTSSNGVIQHSKSIFSPLKIYFFTSWNPRDSIFGQWSSVLF